jgi:hypothetical protein
MTWQSSCCEGIGSIEGAYEHGGPRKIKGDEVTKWNAPIKPRGRLVSVADALIEGAFDRDLDSLDAIANGIRGSSS